MSIVGPQNADARSWYQGSGMALLKWSSLAGGFLTGRFQRTNLETFSRPCDQLSIRTYASEETVQRLDRAAALAREKGVTLPQIALAYVLSQPLNSFALVAPATAAEVRTTAATVELTLTSTELAWLDLTEADHERSPAWRRTLMCRRRCAHDDVLPLPERAACGSFWLSGATAQFP